MRGVRRALTELYRCHNDRGNTEAVLALEVTRRDLAEFAKTVERLARATEPRSGTLAQQAMRRAFLQMRDDADKIDGCRPAHSEDATGSSSEPEDSRPEPKAKKKKNKKG
jgi:hypothetical protein